jgi:hypothetical protein
MCVHNETSTGIISRIGEVRRALDAAKHPALLFVDAVSSLASLDYRQDEWRADVTVAGSQQGHGEATRLGDFNDLMLCGTLSGIEMGLARFGVPFRKGGVTASMDYLT